MIEQAGRGLRTASVKAGAIIQNLFGAYTSPARIIIVAGLLLLIAISPISIVAQDTAPAGVSVIQRIRERDNTLVAGMQYDFPPYEFIGDDGQVTGFHVGLIRALAARWGIEVEFIPVTASDRLQKLQAGVVDIVPLEETSIDLLMDGNSLSISHFYQQDQIGLLVQRVTDASGTSTQNIADFDGANVAIVTGSGADKLLKRAGSTDDASDQFAIGDVTLAPLPFREYGPALSALRAGQVNAALGPMRFLVYAADQAVEVPLGLTALEETLAQERFALGFSRGDPYFRGLVDSTLQQLWADGTLPALSSRWLGGDGDSDNLLTSAHVGEWPYTFADSPVVLPDNIDVPDALSADTFLDRRRLIVGIPYDLSPYGFISDEGTAIGFGADIARALAERWLGDSEAVELVPVTAQTRLPLLATGAVDLVIAPTTPNWYDEADVDFSEPFLWDTQSLLMQSVVLLQTFEDLEGQGIAVISGSRADVLIRAQAEALNIQISILPFQEYPSALQSLRAKQVVAVAGPNSALTIVAARGRHIAYSRSWSGS